MEQGDKKHIGRTAATLLLVAATLGLAMAGGLVGWQGIANIFKGDDTTKTAETKTGTEAAAKPSESATCAHTTAFSGMPFALSVEGCSVTGEAGSVTESAEISVTAIDSLPPLAAGMVNVTRGHAGYRLSPAGLRFARPVTVELGYDSLLLPRGHSAREIRTFLYNSEKRYWEALPRDSVMEGSQNIVSQSRQAGEMVNAIVQLPELPESKAFTPAMLTELEAAHPAAGVTVMEPPAANSQGTASLSYPISVPAGRNGLQPNLSVSYSSEAGNGLLGMGWDMQLPAITVDSKWGAPRYDSVYETECYSYNGQELLPSPRHMNQWERRDSGGVKVFRPRTEGAFEKIVRYGTTPKNYFWVVTDKNGTKYYYGNYAGYAPALNILPQDQKGNIGRWPLCRVEDMDGNEMCYYYQLRHQHSSNGTYLGVQLWLESIVYTGNSRTGEEGKYKVFFGSGNCVTDTMPRHGEDTLLSGKTPATKKGGSSGGRNHDVISSDCNCQVSIRVIKTDRCSGMPVEGAGFVLQGEGWQSSVTTGPSGEAFFSHTVSQCDEPIHLHESAPAPNYTVDPVSLALTVDANCNLTVNDRVGIDDVVWNTPNEITVHVSNNPMCPARVEIVKTNSLTREPVQGALFELETGHGHFSDTTDNQGRIVWDFPFSCESQMNLWESVPVSGYYHKEVQAAFMYEAPCRLQLLENTGIDSVEWLSDTSCRLHVSNTPHYLPPDNAWTLENNILQRQPEPQRALLCPCGNRDACGAGYPPDYRTDARNGYLQSCRDKLSRIVIYYEESLVRGYSFCYGSDIFGRAQLLKIAQWGADCSAEPYEHQLDYYTEGSAGDLLNEHSRAVSGADSLYETDLGMAFHKLTRPLSTMYAAIGGPTMLSAYRSCGLGSSGGADVGTDGNPESKEWSVALSAGASTRSGRGLGTLIDIDGDGLPDRVFKHGGQVYYQPQTAAGFGAKKRMSGFSDFLSDRSNSFNCGLSANLSLHGGVSWNRTSSKTSSYFCDINGDGLLDLVHDNACDGVTPLRFPPSFVSDGCGLRVEQDTATVTPCISMYGIPEPEAAGEDSVSWPFYDMVRVWSNEMTKDIRLTEVFAKACLDANPLEDAVETEDTLILSVEFYGRTLNQNYPATYHFVLAEAEIHPGECVWENELLANANNMEIPLSQLDLDEGCLLLFRIRSLHGRPVSHLLHWDPTVRTGFSPPTGVGTHGNAASDSDFPRATDSVFTCPATGTLRIEVMDIDTQYHGVYNGYGHLITKRDTTLHVVENQTLMFMAEGDSSVLWQDHQWHPYVYYLDVDSAISTESTLVTSLEGETVPLFDFHPAPYYRCYRASQGPYPQSFPHPVFGSMYGGWGAFQYRHSDSSIMDTVKMFSKCGLPSDFNFNINSYVFLTDTDRTCSLADSAGLVLDSLTRFLDVPPLTPDNENLLYRGLFPNAYVREGHICLGYLPEEPAEGVSPQQGCNLLQTANGCSVAAQRAHSKSGNVRMLSYGSMDKVSVSDGFSISCTKPGEMRRSVTRSILNRSRMTQDLVDLNGDGVPDFIRSERVYYSRPDLSGWESAPRTVFPDGHHLAKSSSTNLNFSARVSLPIRKTTASGKGTSVVNCSAGAGISLASDTVLHTLADINGDGLPDLVFSNGDVKLNTGYGFAGQRRWDGLDAVGVHRSSGSSASGSDISLWKDAVSGGINLTLTENEFVITLLDINGDGLPDLVQRRGCGTVLYRPNTGIGFSSPWICWKNASLYSLFAWDNSSSADMNVNTTAGGLFLGLKWGGSIGVDGSISVSNSRMQITDFNGDGVPDLLLSADNSTLHVHYAHLGRTGLLKTVTNPLGGSITMGYDLTEASVYHPRRWVMTSVMTHDSLPGDGCDSLRIRIRYDHGYHDRTERDFLGFAVVVSEPLDGSGNAMRTTIRYYDNSSVHTKGSLRCEAVVRIRNSNGASDTVKYLTTTCDYSTSNITVPVANGTLHSVFPKLTRRQTCFFEGLPQAQVTAWEEFGYEDTYGNVIRQRQGSTGQQTVEATVTHHAQYNGNHCVNRVSSVEIAGYRKRTTEVDSKGHYTVFRDWCDNTHPLTTRLQYDQYGNVTAMRGPNTTVHYTYDNHVHTYPTAIEDTFGVRSELLDYDFRFGIPRTVVDQAESRMEYTLDEWGRTATIRGPKEIAAGKPFTIRYTYAGKDAACRVSMAMTENYDPQHPTNPIKTYTYCDGLGRIVQTRKEAEVNGVEKLVISGHTVVDALGRTVATYYPTEIHKDSTLFRFITDNSAPAATATYDVLDRPLVQTAPDGSTTTFQYGFNNSHLNGRMLFSTTTTDANSHSSTELKDVSGRPWAVQAAGRPFVYFEYNLAGDNTKVYSSVANDWERNYTYDWLGRRLTYQEGELAESLTYDGSNLSTHTQSWSENGLPQTKTTQYHYTAHRLDSVSYDDALTTIYHYDQYGRVDSLYDESGVVCYEYGNMGEVTQETRIYALPFLNNALALSTQFTYDSWGRILNITYPDNEIVNYDYDLGGQLFRFCNNGSYSYLDSVLYDRFGAKTSQKYGNGLKTNYIYDSYTRRLSQITVTDNSNNPYGDIQYGYDPVGNVTQVTSSCPWLNNQNLTETFTYDASDQLVSASETNSGSYQLAVSYGNWGKISSYDLTQTDLQSNTTTQASRSMTYPGNANNLGNSQTIFAPTTQNGDEDVDFTFGINGSLRRREVHSPTLYTEYCLFNSQANLKAYSNNGLDFAYYGYNATNTRTYKLSMLNMNQWVNGQPEPLDLQLQQVMFYPNAYINFNQNGEYTKHYYNGSERIASRLGDVNLSIAFDYDDMLETHRAQIEERFRLDMQALLNEEVPVDNLSMLDVSSLQQTGNPTDVFYYHPNHLGSTAFVTDENATVTQGFLYTPFGEITTEYAPLWQNGTLPKYSFNAKELDEETGMYYYEARYYKPPVFTSRDPMFEKYFWMTPYAYCANNPVKYVDPSGRNYEGYITGEGAEAATVQLNASTSLEITRDPNTGKLSASGEIKTQRDQDLFDAINDPNIRVEIIATYSDYTPDGTEFDAGAFMGNTVTPVFDNNITNNKPYSCLSLLSYNKVTTKQVVNPFKMATLDMFYGEFGQNMLHEFMESYIGGQISQESGVSASPAYSIKGVPIPNAIYDSAHGRAPFQPGDGVSTREEYEIMKNILNYVKSVGNNYGVFK